LKGVEFPSKRQALEEKCRRRSVEVVLLNFQKDGFLIFWHGVGVEHDARDAAPAAAAAIGRFKPVEFTL